MLVIAPMPVDCLRDRDALEKLNSRRIKVPAIPCALEEELPKPEPAIAFEEVEPDHGAPLISGLSSSDSGFIVTGFEPQPSVVLPPKRGVSKRQIGSPTGKAARSLAHDKSLYRPAAPVSEVVPQVEEDYQHNVVYRTYLFVGIVVFLFLFLGIVIYVVKTCSPEQKTAPASLRPVVYIENPDFSHLQDQYGEQVKQAQLAEKMDPKNLKTTVVQEAVEEEE